MLTGTGMSLPLSTTLFLPVAFVCALLLVLFLLSVLLIRFFVGAVCAVVVVNVFGVGGDVMIEVVVVDVLFVVAGGVVWCRYDY